MTTRTRLGLLAALIFVSFWPVYIWYLERSTDGSDEPLGLLALIACFLSVGLRARGKKVKEGGNEFFLYLAIASFLFYILSFSGSSKMVSAAFAVVTLTASASALIMPLLAGEYCLALISLPVIASLNFFIGFPLRALSAKLASISLSLGNVSARAEGTMLVFKDQMVAVDAPCSGIKMLWFSVFTAALTASYLKLSPLKTGALLIVSVVFSVIANTLRVTALFYLETGLISHESTLFEEAFLHQAIGLVVFLLLILSIVFFGTKITAQIRTSKEEGKALSKPSMATMAILSMVATILPATVGARDKVPVKRDNTQINWPDKLDGKVLKEVPVYNENKKLKSFLADFPGQVKVFSDGKRIYIVRYVNKMTRKLHPASDCYRAAGYRVEFQPTIIKSPGEHWSSFRASRADREVMVRERITDNLGKQWTEPSAWYWSALKSETKAPWWGITVEEGD
ncbi:hypothetical protein GC174_12505 [bacterium]|nr:hypothetical protein [bacterium]